MTVKRDREHFLVTANTLKSVATAQLTLLDSLHFQTTSQNWMITCMCGPMNRESLVCSECIEKFDPSVTFFEFPCSSCTRLMLGMGCHYLFLEFVPCSYSLLFYTLFLYLSNQLHYLCCSTDSLCALLSVCSRYSIVCISFWSIFNWD